MKDLQKRAEALARAQQRLAIARMGNELSARIRGVAVETESDRVVLSGKRLLARWLVDPSLRFVADMSR